jgi:hypothetical protein
LRINLVLVGPVVQVDTVYITLFVKIGEVVLFFNSKSVPGDDRSGAFHARSQDVGKGGGN